MNPMALAMILGSLAFSGGTPDMPHTTYTPPEGAGRRRQRDPKPPKNDGAVPTKTLRRRAKKAARTAGATS